MKRSKEIKSRNFIIVSLIIIVLISISLYLIYLSDTPTIKKKDNYQKNYIASDTNDIDICTLTKEEDIDKLVCDTKITRGKEVLNTNKTVIYEDIVYTNIIVDNKKYYVMKDNLTTEKENIITEKTLYTRTTTTIINNKDDSKINGLSKKGEELEVIGYDYIKEDGSVNLYKVKQKDIEGYIYGKYLVKTKEESLKNYNAKTYDKIHGKIKNSYGGGEAIKLDFYPNEKPKFENNIMPESVYALYLNCSSNVINNIDSYIEFAKTTNINAFVVDIKDNQVPAYPADTFKNLSPTNYEHAINSYDEFKTAIQKLKEAGFYVIGRITVFKDSYYVKDNESSSITNKNTNEPYLHNGSYWPSPYNRDVWYFNVSLAKESVEKFGFNEINFDYVRFPDRMNSVKNIVDLKNTYNEDKVEAIQRFVQYATDALHELETYVSIDVFGETTNGSYTTAYGQYWPAISNVADVISGMPYPDHFAAGSYGLTKPWNNPYQLMKYWGSYASDRQKEIPTPAHVRTWIQAYDVMKYVDNNGISYGAKEVEEEIRGLYSSGLTGGYITWLSNSSLEKYKTQRKAFEIDYRKEYINE